MAQRAAGRVVGPVMVAVHMMHQNARRRVFRATIANRVVTLLMFACVPLFRSPSVVALRCAS